MTDCVHRSLETNGMRMHVAEQGTGPLVLLRHGLPDALEVEQTVIVGHDWGVPASPGVSTGTGISIARF